MPRTLDVSGSSTFGGYKVLRTAIAAAYVSAETVAASTAAAAKVSGSFLAADRELSALTFDL